MFISAQVSLYPLGQPDLAPAIDDAVNALRQHQLEVAPGAMSTVVSGEDDAVFAALKDAMRRSSDRGQAVMVVTLSNACPVPRKR